MARTFESYSAFKAASLLSNPVPDQCGLFRISRAWFKRFDALAYSLDTTRNEPVKQVQPKKGF